MPQGTGIQCPVAHTTTTTTTGHHRLCTLYTYGHPLFAPEGGSERFCPVARLPTGGHTIHPHLSTCTTWGTNTRGLGAAVTQVSWVLSLLMLTSLQVCPLPRSPTVTLYSELEPSSCGPSGSMETVMVVPPAVDPRLGLTLSTRGVMPVSNVTANPVGWGVAPCEGVTKTSSTVGPSNASGTRGVRTEMLSAVAEGNNHVTGIGREAKTPEGDGQATRSRAGGVADVGDGDGDSQLVSRKARAQGVGRTGGSQPYLQETRARQAIRSDVLHSIKERIDYTCKQTIPTSDESTAGKVLHHSEIKSLAAATNAGALLKYGSPDGRLKDQRMRNQARMM
eukprot:1159050-Pelagomonas_calceolata.AAC.3